MKQGTAKTLTIIDISSFIFRAFYAIRALKAPDGEPTNALFGVASMLGKLFDGSTPGRKIDYALVAYDSKEPSFREAMDPNYKANRSEPPEDLIPQFDRIEELVRLLKIPSLRQAGIEADDFIGTVAYRWVEQGPDFNVVVISGDKDLMQLVGPQISVYDTMTEKFYDRDAVIEKWGVPPEKIADLLGIMGDSSDNIPGVKGIGPKGAVELIKEFGDLEGILAAAKAGKVAGKKGTLLVEQAEGARLSKQLATLKLDCSMNGWEENLESNLRYHFQPDAKCIEFLRGRGFRLLVEKWSKLAGEVPASSPTAPVRVNETSESPRTEPSASQGQTSFSIPWGASPNLNAAAEGKFFTVRQESELLSLLSEIEKQGEFAFDLETTSLNPREARLVGIAIAFESSKYDAYYIPVGHTGLGVQQLEEKWVLDKLGPILINIKLKKIGQNLKYDLSILHEMGVEVLGLGADTMVASYLLEPEGRHNLETLAKQYLDNYQVLSYEAVCGKGKNQITFDQVPIDLATRYSAEDAWITYRLWKVLQPRLEKEGLLPVFSEIDMPLVPILMKMEAYGVQIDAEYLKTFSGQLLKNLNEIEKRVLAYSANPVNLNSPKQLGHFLFEELKLPTQGKTKTGYSTDAEVLEKLSPLHEVPRLLLEYREISKLKGTYVDPLPQMRDPKDGRIHAHFHQTVAATGRLSSSDPNLQNIPIRTERGRKVRRAFIAAEGFELLSADYSQIELRILAHMSGDPELCGSFKKEEDVHRRTASEIYGVSPEAVNDEQRGVAKAINFGLMYGKTPFGLSQELKISRKEAAEMISRYFERYQGVKKYLDSAVATAKEKGEVTTLSGRVRRLPDIHSKNPMIRANAERMAMNSPIQGTAADMIKIAMIRLQEALEQMKLRSRLIVQVHDELVLEVAKEEKAEVLTLVKEKMENAMKLDVPLKVNAGFALNWLDC